MYISKLLRRYYRKLRPKKPLGFTLIELLIGMILAFLVMAPMLGFMVNLLESDNAEQAKSTTEQEVQASLDYIARDLQQAIYIYDNTDRAKNPVTPGILDFPIKSEIPPSKPAPGCKDSKCKPILAFWKRQLIQEAETITEPTVNPYVYSLVVYYSITGNQGSAANSWSKAQRIGRFEIRDGVRKSPPPNNLPLDTKNDDQVLYYDKADPTFGTDSGFKLFELKSGISNLDLNMNSWKADGAAYTSPVAILVDYIDPTPWKDGNNNLQCPPDPTTAGQVLSRIPKLGEEINGFYSCVNTKLWVAQVFIRGNAMFRFKPNCESTKAECKYSEQNKTFFPRSTVQVRGQGFLDVQ